MNRRFLLGIALILSTAIPAFGTDVQGAVVDDAGRGVANATVLYGRLAANSPKGKYFVSGPTLTARTDANGKFALTNVAPATYLLCLSGTGVIDPCHWSALPPRVIVGANEPPATVVIHAQKSYQLPIRLNDPSNQLQFEGKQAGAVVSLGAWAASGAFLPAKLASSDAAGRTYTVAIPYDTPVQFFAGGTAFQLQNAVGLAALAPQGSTLQVTASTNGAPPSLSFTITGTTKH
jgi:hypothetical protein